MKTEHRQPDRIFEDRVVSNPDVCSNCYRLLFDRIAVPRLIAEFRDSAPDSVRSVRVRNVDDDPAGLFCRCGSDGVTQPDQRPRDPETTERHAKNAARTMSALGHDIDADAFVRETLRLRTESDRTGVEMFREAVKHATTTETPVRC